MTHALAVSEMDRIVGMADVGRLKAYAEGLRSRLPSSPVTIIKTHGRSTIGTLAVVAVVFGAYTWGKSEGATALEAKISEAVKIEQAREATESSNISHDALNREKEMDRKAQQQQERIAQLAKDLEEQRKNKPEPIHDVVTVPGPVREVRVPVAIPGRDGCRLTADDLRRMR